MTALLRVVLDQLGAGSDPDLTRAERELARALVRTAPDGCAVAAVVPAGDEVAAEDAVPDLASVTRAALKRRELAEAWRRGLATGVAGGMLHAPSLFAPLSRHDRVNDGDQTVVTLWDLRAWEHPEALSRGKRRVAAGDAAPCREARGCRGRADARDGRGLGELSRLGSRIRVIAGAAPVGFAAPLDAAARRGTFQVPEGAVVLDGGAPHEPLAAVFRSLSESGIDLPLVVFDAEPAQEARLVETAASAGFPWVRCTCAVRCPTPTVRRSSRGRPPTSLPRPTAPSPGAHSRRSRSAYRSSPPTRPCTARCSSTVASSSRRTPSGEPSPTCSHPTRRVAAGPCSRPTDGVAHYLGRGRHARVALHAEL